MINQLYFCIDYYSNVEEALLKEGVKYKRTLPEGFDWLCFYIDRDSPAFAVVDREMKLAGVKATGHLSLVFTDEELDNAEWLAVRTTCKKIDDCQDKLYFASCGNETRGGCYFRYRTSPIWCERKVKWGSNHFFYSSYWLGYDELFCSDLAKGILCRKGIPFAYEGVYSIRKGNEAIPDINHIVPCNILPIEAIITDNLMLQSACEKCGVKTYMLGDDAQLTVLGRYLYKDAIAYGTPRIFGPGWAKSALIVSQEFRQIIIKNGMQRGLKFTPVIIA